MYLTYADYESMGGTLKQAVFQRLEFKARSLVDTRTFGRLKGLTEAPEAVKRLIFELVAVSEADIAGGAVTSVSNDGYSETYAVVNNEEKALNLIAAYLSTERTADGTPLLYRGVM